MSLRQGYGGKAPNVPLVAKRCEKSSQGAKRHLTGYYRDARFYLQTIIFLHTVQTIF